MYKEDINEEEVISNLPIAALEVLESQISNGHYALDTDDVANSAAIGRGQAFCSSKWRMGDRLVLRISLGSFRPSNI
jgi:hypothetical protein